MNNEEKKEHLDKLDADCNVVNLAKGKDYATADVLSNFKRLASAAQALDIDTRSPEGYALFMVLMKIDRINNLLKVRYKRQPVNESIKDSFVDGINYLKLAYLTTIENEPIFPEEEG